MYFVVEKESDADVVWHFFICYSSLLTIEATYSKLVCYFTPRSSSFSPSNSSALHHSKIWDNLHQCISTCSN